MSEEEDTNVEINPKETMTLTELSDIVTSQKELHCIHCFKFLLPPIMLGKKGNICGKCSKNSSVKLLVHNIALEKTLEKLSIRCMNSDNGCKVRSNYKEMALHNIQCVYRSLTCIINLVESCAWSGCNNKLVEHIIQEHSHYVIKTTTNFISLNINITKKTKDIKLIILLDKIFLSLINTDIVNETLSVSVFYIDDFESEADNSNDHQFVLQLYASQNDSIKLETNKFPVVNFSNYNKNYSDGLKLHLDQVKNFSTGVSTLRLISNLSKNKASEELLKHFECPVCNNYMRAPIQQCNLGHNICNKCKPKLQNCPTCRTGFGSSRNYALENFSNDFYFPCTNRGCKQYILGKDTAEHEDRCRFRSYVCPFENESCSWTDLLTNLSDHLKNIHSNHNVFTRRQVELISVNKVYCIVAYGKIFRVSYTFDPHSSYAKWAVQLVGSTSECTAYSYEITVIDKKNPSKQLILRNLCQEYTSHRNVFNKFINLLFTAYSTFPNYNDVTYFVEIVKTKT